MNARLTLATAGRVLRQVRHDRRTVALLIVAFEAVPVLTARGDHLFAHGGFVAWLLALVAGVACAQPFPNGS